MLDPKKQFYITLTEPVVFLRTSDPSGRLERDWDDSPALVRGILTLNVVKPIGISSIEVELTGILAINSEGSCIISDMSHTTLTGTNLIPITITPMGYVVFPPLIHLSNP
jgi:hypothetical protein